MVGRPFAADNASIRLSIFVISPPPLLVLSFSLASVEQERRMGMAPEQIVPGQKRGTGRRGFGAGGGAEAPEERQGGRGASRGGGCSAF